MVKLYSLIKACMTSDMNIFKIKTKKSSKASSVLLPLFIALYLMFMIWGGANSLFEKLSPMHLQHFLLSVFAFLISLMTIIEGIYKSGSLIFNCKDDQLLLSLPIKRNTVIFIRIFKFYVFELLYNSLFLLPITIAYIRWAEHLSFSYFITSIVMLLLLPIIPIAISCIIGLITSGFSSKFKYKNVVQIAISMIILIGILIASYSMDNIFVYLVEHVKDLNDIVMKIYYPAGIYAKLVSDFKVLDLLIFITINIVILVFTILILGKSYFKINSRIKTISSNKKVDINNMSIKSKSKYQSLIFKELNTFFKTPVFIINSGFALVLFILAVIMLCIKFDSSIPLLTDPNGLNMSLDLITNNYSIITLVLLSAASFMTSITSSSISLEGKSISILKSMPINTKTILMSKVYSALVITTPVFLLGNIILFVRFKISIIESILLIVLSIIIPLVSHFIGIIVNLKYPKLDAENPTEVVKQSMSSFISVMIGMILVIISVGLITSLMGKINPTILLTLTLILYIVLDLILYLYLSKKGVNEFNSLTI